MSEQTSNSSSGGCGVTVALGAFCLTLGLLVGIVGMYAYLSTSDDGFQRLGLADANVYALAHPLEESFEISADLDENQVRSTLLEQREPLESCYEQHLENSPGTRGEIKLQVNVDGSGDVANAVPRTNGTNSDELADCITDAIAEEWSFDRQAGSGRVSVRFRTLFLPLSTAG